MGRNKLLKNPVRIVTYLEKEDAEGLDLLGKRAETAREALLEYLAREDIQAKIEDRQELIALGDQA